LFFSFFLLFVHPIFFLKKSEQPESMKVAFCCQDYILMQLKEGMQLGQYTVGERVCGLGGGRVGEVRVDWLLAQVPQCKMENEKMKNGCRIQMAVVRWKMVVLI
jgi:hypothetical protein